MASLFKRLKAKVKGDGSEGGEEGEKKQGFVLNLPSGQLSFTDAEADVYTKLALMLDVEGDDSVGGRHGAAFLRRSGLSTDQLREVWKMACGGKSKVRSRTCRPHAHSSAPAVWGVTAHTRHHERGRALVLRASCLAMPCHCVPRACGAHVCPLPLLSGEAVAGQLVCGLQAGRVGPVQRHGSHGTPSRWRTECVSAAPPAQLHAL